MGLPWGKKKEKKSKRRKKKLHSPVIRVKKCHMKRKYYLSLIFIVHLLQGTL